MQYYVVFPNGQKFGPADDGLLNQWIREGRVFPVTLLEDASTGQQFAASQLPGLLFPQAAPAMPPGITNQMPAYTANPQQVNPGNAPQLVGNGYCCPRCNGYLAPGSRACVQCGLIFAYPVPIPGAGVVQGGYQSPIGYQNTNVAPGSGAYGMQPNYAGPYGQMYNTSGMKGDVPPEIASYKWSWGAFGLHWIWLCAHGLPGWGVGLLLLNMILWLNPMGWFVLLALQIYLGAQGHKLAWRYRRYDNIEHFKKVETSWMRWGIAVISILFSLRVLLGIAGMNPYIR